MTDNIGPSGVRHLSPLTPGSCLHIKASLVSLICHEMTKYIYYSLEFSVPGGNLPSLELVSSFSWSKKKKEAVIAGLMALLKWLKQRCLVQSEVLRQVKVLLHVGFLESHAHTSMYIP